MNIVFLIGDDHAAYAYGAYGDPLAKTPNLDRFAESGVRFSNAFCNAPVCTASRQSLLTGKLPHSIGVTQLRSALKEETITIADVMKANGYATAAIGKMHFNSNFLHGFDLLLDNHEYNEYRTQNPPRKAPDSVNVLPQWRPFRDPARVWLNGMYYPQQYNADMKSTWVADQACKYIEVHKDQPFCLFASFEQPHSPFNFPIEYAEMFDPSVFKVPEVGPEDDWQIPHIFRDLTVEQKQKITASYYTATAYLDEKAGQVLDALETNGLSENTMVVYLGDHGYCLGHHGRFEKHCMYEPAIHSPLVIRLPGVTEPGTVDSHLTEFIDLFPTVAEALQVEPPDGLEGNSLMNALKREEHSGRETVFIEYFENEEAMVRTEKFKYIYGTGKRMRQDGYYTTEPVKGRYRMLFDLENDPQEFKNLADEAAHKDLIDTLEEEMLKRFAETSPAGRRMPDGLARQEQLDWYLKAWDRFI